MALSPQAQALTLAAVRRHYGPQARVWLFGSRAREQSRGGDIDLYVEMPTVADRIEVEARVIPDLQRALGDQRIDVVTHVYGAPLRAIDRIAPATGVELTGVELNG